MPNPPPRAPSPLSGNQFYSLRCWVEGRQVIDWGCGYNEITLDMLNIGASSVVGVDKDFGVAEMWELEKQSGKTQCTPARFIRSYVHDVDIDLATNNVSLLSWPVNWKVDGLVERLEKSDTVIYVGVNDDCTVCGDWTLWKHFLNRQLLFYLPGPERESDLIVYGPVEESPRTDLTPHEERALEPSRHGIPPDIMQYMLGVAAPLWNTAWTAEDFKEPDLRDVLPEEQLEQLRKLGVDHDG